MAGINGYWLVWDKLAQFVAIASAEWLDALPIFSDPLARNFLEQGSVNDRFFTLLSLIHIGIPLATFAVIWVHTQRVPNAKTSPPRTMSIALVAFMLALALLKPALSQGPADLNSVPLVLSLDWFYLWSYPLLYIWTPAKVWGLAGGVTGILLLLPFIGRNARNKDDYVINAIPDGRLFSAKQGETILEAALREGLSLPYHCRDGGCGACKGKILKGSVNYGTYQDAALSHAEKEYGFALFCCAKPLCDLDIECHIADAVLSYPVQNTELIVRTMERMSANVMLVELIPDSAKTLNFTAGQYLSVILDDGSKRSFSFANPPHKRSPLELHIRLVPGGKFTGHVFSDMKVGDKLRVEGPYGSFFLHEDSDKPIIFVAGGTGFAPVKSMLERIFYAGLKRQIVFYWGGKTLDDLYMSDIPEKWQSMHDNFKFIPVLSEPWQEFRWTGRTGLVTDAVLEDYEVLTNHQVYACGPPAMVDAGRKHFTARGLPENQYFSDAFLVAHYESSKGAPLKSIAESIHE
jgi:NAD(P)H-flavin reductase/ferredoxin